MSSQYLPGYTIADGNPRAPIYQLRHDVGTSAKLWMTGPEPRVLVEPILNGRLLADPLAPISFRYEFEINPAQPHPTTDLVEFQVRWYFADGGHHDVTMESFTATNPTYRFAQIIPSPPPAGALAYTGVIKHQNGSVAHATVPRGLTQGLWQTDRPEENPWVGAPYRNQAFRVARLGMEGSTWGPVVVATPP